MLVQLLADARDLVDVLLAAVGRLMQFADRRLHVAAINDRAPERGNLIAQTGDPECRRPHVHTTPIAAQVEWHADDVNGFHDPCNAKCKMQNANTALVDRTG